MSVLCGNPCPNPPPITVFQLQGKQLRNSVCPLAQSDLKKTYPLGNRITMGSFTVLRSFLLN